MLFTHLQNAISSTTPRASSTNRCCHRRWMKKSNVLASGMLMLCVTFILVIYVILFFTIRSCEPIRWSCTANGCCLSDFKAIGAGCYKLVPNHSKYKYKRVIDFNYADAHCGTISMGRARLADLDEFTISKLAFRNFINCIGIPTSRNGGKLYTLSVSDKYELKMSLV